MKRLWVILFLWLLVLSIALMIFIFSTQDADASSRTSGVFVDLLIRLLYPDYSSLRGAARAAALKRVTLIVRKAAHFTEFALLGGSLRLLMEALKAPLPAALSWVIGTLYACTDEYHQSFVANRGAAVTDVLIDSAGVLFLVCVVSLILYRKKRKAKAA